MVRNADGCAKGVAANGFPIRRDARQSRRRISNQPEGKDEFRAHCGVAARLLGITKRRHAASCTRLRSVVLRAPGFFARASIGTEMLLTLAFLTAAVALTFPRVNTTRLAVFGVAAASFVGFMFAINLAVLNGDASPWTVGGSPFASGVQVEYLLAGISLMTTAAAGVLFRRTRYLKAYQARHGHQRMARALTISGDPG